MIKILYLLRRYLLNGLIAVMLVTLIIGAVGKNINLEYYNKIFKLKNTKNLSEVSISLIILSVSGDQNFNNYELSRLYKNLQIVHLLVLSGSNISVLRHFISLFQYKSKTSSFIILFLAMTLYYCYISYLHPVARALIFLLLYEYFSNQGVKANSTFLFLIGTLLCIPPFVFFNFSQSFLLSYLFFLLIFVFNTLSKNICIKNPFISKYLLFPVYMSTASLPISYFFFGKVDFFTSLISNTLVVPFYDFLVYLFYLFYFLGFTSISLELPTLLMDKLILFFLSLLRILYSFIRLI